MRRFATAMGILALALAAAAFLWVVANLSDAPDPSDEDLALQLDPRPEPEADVFAGLGEIVAQISLEEAEAEALQGFLQTGRGDGQVESILERHRPLMPTLAEVLSRPASRADLPDLAGDPDPVRVERMRGLQRLSYLVLAEARLAAHRGACPRAFDALSNGFLLATRLRRTEGADLVVFMTAANQLAAAVDVGNALLRPCAPSAAWLAWARRDPDPPGDASWADAIRLEYQVMKVAIQSIDPLEGLPGADGAVRGWLPVEYLFQKNRTLASLAEPYRRMAAGSCRARPTAADPSQPSPWVGLLPNGVGRILIGIARPDYDRYLGRWCDARTRYAAHRALVALRAYRDAEGALPSSLEPLTPEWLAELPVDPATQAPIAYDAEARTVGGVAIPF